MIKQYSVLVRVVDLQGKIKINFKKLTTKTY
jgi:hypothetical protein